MTGQPRGRRASKRRHLRDILQALAATTPTSPTHRKASR